jgi:hypothetical protein
VSLIRGDALTIPLADKENSVNEEMDPDDVAFYRVLAEALAYAADIKLLREALTVSRAWVLMGTDDPRLSADASSDLARIDAILSSTE